MESANDRCSFSFLMPRAIKEGKAALSTFSFLLWIRYIFFSVAYDVDNYLYMGIWVLNEPVCFGGMWKIEDRIVVEFLIICACFCF